MTKVTDTAKSGQTQREALRTTQEQDSSPKKQIPALFFLQNLHRHPPTLFFLFFFHHPLHPPSFEPRAPWTSAPFLASCLPASVLEHSVPYHTVSYPSLLQCLSVSTVPYELVLERTSVCVERLSKEFQNLVSVRVPYSIGVLRKQPAERYG